MSDPNAQGPVDVQQEVNQTEPAAQPPTQPAPNPHEGFQARINEVVAEKHEYRRRAEQLEQQVMQLMATVATQQQRPEPEVEFNDPDAAKAFNAMQQRMAAQLEQMQRKFDAQLQQVQFQQVGQQFAPNVDPVVQQRAAQIWQTWQQRGLQGYTPEDAFIYAQGEHAMKAGRQGVANQQLQAFNRGASVTPTYAPPPPVAPPVNSVPADIDEWDADKQLAFYEKRLNGKKF
jgi:hypothetical protein